MCSDLTAQSKTRTKQNLLLQAGSPWFIYIEKRKHGASYCRKLISFQNVVKFEYYEITRKRRSISLFDP